MPYIDKKDRIYFEDECWNNIDYEFEVILSTITHIIKNIPSGKTKGALNYIVTRLALQVFGTSSYTQVSDAIAALQDAADEIKRRVLAKVEDGAIERNGDLPEYDRLD